jgi:hypothetical protein
MAAVALVLIVVVAAVWRGADEAPREFGGFHISFKSDPSTEVVISWYQMSPGDPLVLLHRPDGSTDIYRAAATYFWGVYWYHVRISGLKPSTTYRYVVLDSVLGFEFQSSFRTAPAGPERFVFTVYGDQGVSGVAGVVVSRVLEYSPAYTYILETYPMLGVGLICGLGGLA